jgi:hypothetical protein
MGLLDRWLGIPTPLLMFTAAQHGVTFNLGAKPRFKELWHSPSQGSPQGSGLAAAGSITREDPYLSVSPSAPVPFTPA